jgi:hypothetical protein
LGSDVTFEFFERLAFDHGEHVGQGVGDEA